MHITPLAIHDAPLRNAWGIHQPLALRALIEVDTDDGLTGISETYGDDASLADLRIAAEAIQGMDVYGSILVERRIASALGDPRPVGEEEGRVRRAWASQRVAKTAACVEIALLDLQGKASGRSIAELLGGRAREHIDMCGYLFFKPAAHPGEPDDEWGAALDPAGMVEQATRMVDRFGFRSLKLKGGVFSPEYELEVLTALHEAFPEHALRYDPNAAWTEATSERMLPRFAGLVEYIEDPVTGIDAMGRAARHSPVPLATNMAVTRAADLEPAIRAGTCDIVLADHHFWGGARETVRLGAVCSAFGLGMSMHSNTHLGLSLAAMTQIAGAIPELSYACDTHTPWAVEDICAAPPVIVDGRVEVGAGHGLGVDLDRDAVAELHRRWSLSGVRSRDDEGAMRRYDPTWTGRLPRY